MLCSSSAVSAGVATLALLDCEACLAAAQVSAALSMEGFRANLSPLDPRVAAARPAPGQEWAASGLLALLAGGALTEPGAARRLQDPLSFRCASQIHGSLHSRAWSCSPSAVAPELNGADDNPLVLAADDEILSTGNFHVPALALALDATAIGVAQVASAITERAGAAADRAAERTAGQPGRRRPDPLRDRAAAEDRAGADDRDPPPGGAARDPGRRSAPTASRTTRPLRRRRRSGSATSSSASGC